MGYEVHITRARHWTESESVPITLEEWKEYVATDREMRMDNFAEATTSGGDTIRYENEGLAVWIPSGCWLDFRRGRIVAKNPDEETLAKMKSIAEQFGARVFGDEGELY
jgi:hypothetical protein